MNILSLSRKEVQDMIASGFMRPENLKHYDICKAMASGSTQEKTAEAFGIPDDRHIRYIKKTKCPDCNKH